MATDALRMLITLNPVLLALGPLLVGWGAVMQFRRDARIAAAAQALGARRPSARFAARHLRHLPEAEALAIFDSPEVLADLLAQKMKLVRNLEDLTAVAEPARQLLLEIDGLHPAFEGAPLLFDPVTIGDGSDTPSISGFVCSVDERNLGVIAHQRCPWPVRTVLVVTGRLGDTEPFTAWLLLRPMPGYHEWLLNHELCDDQTNRRVQTRVPVEICSWTLESTERVAAIRDRLRRGDRVDIARLRRTDGWALRHRIRIRDLSPDGALLDMDHEISPGDRFHLVIPADDVVARPGAGSGEVHGKPPNDLRISALPLVEAVSVRLGAGGRLVVGTRFCAMRFKERRVLQDRVRRAAARHRQALHQAEHQTPLNATGQADVVDLAGGV